MPDQKDLPATRESRAGAELTSSEMTVATPRGARRDFLRRAAQVAGVAGATLGAGALAPQASAQAAGSSALPILPAYTRRLNYRSLKQSSHDTSGGNRDHFSVEPGATQVLFEANAPGVITHIWFTIAAPSVYHLKELVLRAYWDGSAKPSVEVPVGDFFGLNLADYVIYESEYLACSPGKSLNCYFAMPYKKSARMTVTNEGSAAVGAFYSNIDYLEVPSLPEDTLYFHAQYRQAAPNKSTTLDWKQNSDANRLKNPDGKDNYVFAETRGQGHLMGVTLGVLQNQEFWMGEGDDMIFIDDETKPAIIGTGSEDYFLGSWNFGGRNSAIPFAHHQYGAQYIELAERTGGRYLCYRFHGDNPVTFNRYLKHTMEHGHANHRGDSWYSCCYWYQAQPSQDFPPLPPVAERVPQQFATGGPGSAKG
jgi:hypothetical protein